MAAYFRFEVTISESSQKVQLRDLTLFRDFMIDDSVVMRSGPVP